MFPFEPREGKSDNFLSSSPVFFSVSLCAHMCLHVRVLFFRSSGVVKVGVGRVVVVAGV